LPARLKPVTARLTVEPLANSARSSAPENHSEKLAPTRSNSDFSDMPFIIGMISHQRFSAVQLMCGDYVPNIEAGPRSTIRAGTMESCVPA
jgi:hypothetical protein